MICIDQLNRSVELGETPSRVISLVPSQTEFLADCGIDDRLVGLTKFCVHPSGLKKEVSSVGGTKNLKFDVIERLKPDLIIANKEENRREDVEQLEKNYPVWVSDVKDQESALEMMSELSEVIELDSTRYLDEIRFRSDQLISLRKPKGSVLYIIWNDPVMSVGGDTFIHHMLESAGFENLLVSDLRYPELNKEAIHSLTPDYVFLSSEPYPFKEEHLDRFKDLFPRSNVMLVDGEAFSWYGTRMIKGLDYIMNQFY